MTEDKKDLIIAALRERIGTLISNYEMEIAIIRADYTTLKLSYDQMVATYEEERKLNDPKKLYRESGENV